MCKKCVTEGKWRRRRGNGREIAVGRYQLPHLCTVYQPEDWRRGRQSVEAIESGGQVCIVPSDSLAVLVSLENGWRITKLVSKIVQEVEDQHSP